ncbi:hypothetical protein EDB85DRAFT_2286338 [Lactarius pseudohatsudake]|nr:hypothetical protein EDB85DRAFT_2286338 [Lactarius pseudohatsudake]
MDPSKANPRKYLREAIDAEIKSESLEDSIRALRHRRNALAPVSSLSTEIIADIFSFLHLPGRSPLGGEPDNHLVPLRVAHVCHRWREIALDLPFLWSHVDFATVSLAGATEMLARARMAPLYLEARIPVCYWGGAQFIAFQKELQTHVSRSRIRHLSINAGAFHLRKTLEGLVSPAPILEYLSLSNENDLAGRPSVPDTLFDSATPMLSCLKLRNCNISWKSPLLKGLENLEILMLSVNAKPSLAVWLDALDEMPQLKTLVLHSASPIGSFPFNVERTITLPFLTHLGISAKEGECALALAHLVLPALTWLCLTVKSSLEDEDDVQKLLPYVTPHAHGPQDARPLQSVLIHGERKRTDIFAWPAPDTDLEVHDPLSFRAATLSARVRLSVVSKGWLGLYAYVKVIDAAMAALPLDNLVMLTVQKPTCFYKHVWRRHAPRWPLLQCVRLASLAAGGLREVLLQDNGGRDLPLLPSLIKFDLIETSLGARRTLRLCDALMKRVEQGVPLEALGLNTCDVTDHAVRLLSEIVVDIRGPAEFLEGRIPFSWDSVARGHRDFVDDDNSGAEYENFSDYDYETDSFTSDEDSEEESYSQMEEDMPSLISTLTHF